MKLGLRKLLTEVRVIGELATFAGDTLLNRYIETPAAPKPALLIPGLMASDATLYPLAVRLRMAGHQVFFASIWCNADCPTRTMKRLETVLQKASQKTGERVAVIGHSLGGIYARELARRLPDLVERAILLGAPLKHAMQSSNLPIRTLTRMMKFTHQECLTALGSLCSTCGVHLPATPPEVPETIIYTKSDGVVNWRSCLEHGANVEAVEVHSSHCGLGVSVEAWNVIADRLAGDATRNPTPCRRGGSDGRHLRLV